MAAWYEYFIKYIPFELQRFGYVIGVYILITLIELALPAESGHGWRGRLRNLVFGLIYYTCGLAFLLAVMMFFPWTPRRIDNAVLVILSTPWRIEFDGWVATVGLAVTYLLMFDFFYYWYHRAQHQFSWLWQIHELHHADRELNVTSSTRTYWLERPVQHLVVLLPAQFIVGKHANAMWIASLVLTSFLLFTHTNIRRHLGPLTRYLCGPHVHRIHHSRLRRHQDRNFAQIFTFYDVIFRTYYHPARDEFPETGTQDLASDAPLHTVLSRPFIQWCRSLLPGSREGARR
ncbi:MAG: hypothetical protein CMJ18_10440 [Phycisphaeraceae bacterium]|nr:hypothetical protein [Phycisphaeraceae bacterium]